VLVDIRLAINMISPHMYSQGGVDSKNRMVDFGPVSLQRASVGQLLSCLSRSRLEVNARPGTSYCQAIRLMKLANLGGCKIHTQAIRLSVRKTRGSPVDNYH
jgi:hypothetical protein